MNHKTDFYKYFRLSNVPTSFKKKQEITQLFTIPQRDEPSSRFYNFDFFLYLPDDRGYKFCLVVCDVATS